MTDAEIAAYFQNRGFAVLAVPRRDLARSTTDDLVAVRIQSMKDPDQRGPFSVIFSRGRARVIGEQDGTLD